MIALWITQALLALVLLWSITRTFSRYGRTALDLRADEVLRAAVEDGIDADIDGFRSESALTGDFARALVEAKEDRLDIGLVCDDVVREISFRWSQRRQGFRVIASLGSMTALVGACWQFLWLTSGDHGLATLVPGLPLRWATSRAATAAAAGFGITLVAASATKVSQRIGADETNRARRLAERLEALDPAPAHW